MELQESEFEPMDPIGGTPEPVPLPANVSDGQRRGLDPKAVPAMRVGNWIGIAVIFVLGVAGVLGFYFIADESPLWVTGLIAGGVGVFLAGNVFWTLFWPPIYCRRVSFRVGTLGFEIRRGVIWRRVQVVPRTRIQHTDVSQGPVQRRYGLATLTLHTAGTMNSSIELSGIARETALEIRDFLIEETGGDDAV